MSSDVSVTTNHDDILKDGSHVENLLDTLLSFQQRSLFCDTMILTNNGGSVFAHSAVLAAICPGLLTSLNQKPFTVHQPNVIDFAQYETRLIEKLIMFFYTGRLCPKEADQLIEILDMLGVAFNVINMNTEGAFSTEQVVDAFEIKQEQDSECVSKIQYGTSDGENGASDGENGASDGEIRLNVVDKIKDLKGTCLNFVKSTRSVGKRTDKGWFQLTTKPERKYTRRKTALDKLIDERAIPVVEIPEDPNGYFAESIFSDPSGFIVDNHTKMKSEGVDKEPMFLALDIVQAFNDGCDVVDTVVSGDVRATGKYICPVCDTSFKHNLALNRHKFGHYRAADGLFQCNMCSKRVKLRDTLTRHLRFHEETNLGIVRTPKRRSDSIDIKKWKPHECPICSHRFVTPSRLKAHLNAHSGAKPHMCDQCGNRYNDSNELTKHKRRHRGDQRYVCDVCGRKFYTSKLRSIHVKTHTGEKPYQCTECGAQFTQMPSLKCHMLLHTGELPYHCHICPKSFRRPTRLKLHILNAHTAQSERPFKCDLCGRGFSLRGYLAQHKLTHNPAKRGKNCKPLIVGVFVSHE